MKILHLNQFGSHRGGAEGYIADVSGALQTAGHAAHLIAFTPEDSHEPIASTTTVPLPEWQAVGNDTLDAINRVISDFRPDTAYIHSIPHPEVVKWIAARLPTIAYVHGPYVVCPGSAQYLRRSMRVCPHAAGPICLFNAQVEKCCWGRDPLKHLRLLARVRAFRHAHADIKVMFVGSQFMRQLLIRGGFPSHKIRLLSPVLIDEVQSLPEPPVDSNTVLYAGRLTREKGLRHLIEALAAISIDWRLIVAGDGPDREACQALVNRLGLTAKIQFVGWLNASEMAQQFQECAVVAFPSLWPEPFGRIGPEAYRHGKPVVAYATGGVHEWLVHGVTGYLVEAGNLSALGQSLQTLLESPLRRAQMGQAARQMALANWQTKTHLQQLLSAIHDARGD